jgi:flagellar basal body rod protein FlgC
MLLHGARQIAFGGMDGYADAFVEIMRARHSFSANVKVVQAQQEMDRSLLDIIA